MKSRDDSTALIPSTDSTFEEPTSNAEFEIRVEAYNQYTAALAVKLPGKRAGLLLSIVTVVGIVTSGPLLVWATRVTLTAEQLLLVAGIEMGALLVVGVWSGQARKKNK